MKPSTKATLLSTMKPGPHESHRTGCQATPDLINLMRAELRQRIHQAPEVGEYPLPLGRRPPLVQGPGAFGGRQLAQRGHSARHRAALPQLIDPGKVRLDRCDIPVVGEMCVERQRITVVGVQSHGGRVDRVDHVLQQTQEMVKVVSQRRMVMVRRDVPAWGVERPDGVEGQPGRAVVALLPLLEGRSPGRDAQCELLWAALVGIDEAGRGTAIRAARVDAAKPEVVRRRGSRTARTQLASAAVTGRERGLLDLLKSLGGARSAPTRVPGVRAVVRPPGSEHRTAQQEGPGRSTRTAAVNATDTCPGCPRSTQRHSGSEAPRRCSRLKG